MRIKQLKTNKKDKTQSHPKYKKTPLQTGLHFRSRMFLLHAWVPSLAVQKKQTDKQTNQVDSKNVLG